MQGKQKPPAGDAAKGAESDARTDESTAEKNSKQAIEFLKRHSVGWAPEWYLQLCTFEPVNDVRAVQIAEIDRLLPFIDQYQDQNLYHAVNPLFHDPGKKCSREDIAALAYVHVDLDPPKVKLSAEQLAIEQQRLQEAVEALPVPPGSLVNSGNGLAAYWRVPPVLVNPDDRRNHADALGDTNRRLAHFLGADTGATDISRVMRLPFTTNYPTKTKLTLERPISTAKLVYQNAVSFNLDTFADLPVTLPKVAAIDLGELDLEGIDELSLATRYSIHQQHEPDLKLLLEGKAPAWSTDKTGSGLDHAYALTLNRLGYSRNENIHLLSNYEHGKKSRVRDLKYLKATVDKFYAPKEQEPGSPPKRDEYYIASFAERRKNRKPNRWQVKGRFRRGTLNIIFGASGTYKSTTLVGLAVSINCRPYWHDCLIENGGGGVLIIAAEDDEGIVDMIEAACIEYGVNPDDVSVYITHGGYDLSNPEVIQGIKNSITTMPVPLSAIVVDTLNRNCGGLDENSASDMRTFLNMLEELRGDATVYVIHHNGHGDKQRERGSYAIRCNADSSVLCEYVEDTKLFTMTWEKLRSAPTPKPLTLKPKAHVIRQEADSMGELENVTAVCMVMAGEDLRQAREDAFYRKYPELGAGKRRSFLRVLLARIFNKPDETQTALAAVCGVCQSVISSALVALRNRGFVTEESLQLTKAGVEALNEITLDVAVSFKADGHDVGLLAREKPVNAQEEPRNALL